MQAAAGKFFDSDIDILKKLLKDSAAKWDESAFGSGRYGNDDTSSALPSMSLSLQGFHY